MTLGRNDQEMFRRAVEEVTRQLADALHRSDGSYIRTPLVFPSGSSVVVRVSDSYPDFFVSDDGAGYEEAELMGGGTIYVRQGKTIAERAGVGFDNRSFFVIKVSRSQLPGAVVTVANCAQQAATVTALRLAERRQADDGELLYSRLVKIFPARQITREASIIGRSTHEWHVSALVRSDDHQTVFEPVATHANSIYAASTKLRDIASNDNAPQCVAVVRRRSDLREFLSILQESAHVIERDSPDDTIRRLAAVGYT